MLPEINYSLKEEELKPLVFAALKSKGGFILNLDFSLSRIINTLFAAYDDFREQAESEKIKYAGDSKELKGYFYKGIVDGNKAGPRFFIKRDADGAIRHPMPLPYKAKIGMQEADNALFPHIKEITNKTLRALEYGFNLQNNEFCNQFHGYTVRTSVHHYLPVTQEKLKHWIEYKNLTKTEDGRIEAFSGHKDLVPLSILIYRNNDPNGLELEITETTGKKSYQPIIFTDTNPEKLKAIVILGRGMENLTDNLLHGVAHRVIAKPMVKSGQTFSRDGINIFIFLNPEKKLQPVIVAHDGPHYAPVSPNEFYSKWSHIYSQGAEERSLDALSVEEFSLYPKEVEVEVKKTERGMIYRRI